MKEIIHQKTLSGIHAAATEHDRESGEWEVIDDRFEARCKLCNGKVKATGMDGKFTQ